MNSENITDLNTNVSEETTSSTTEVRGIGKAMPLGHLQALSNAALINRILTFVRTDFGGQSDREAVTRKRVYETVPEVIAVVEELTPENQEIILSGFVAVAIDTAAGCRRRLATTIEELRRRFVPKTSSSENIENIGAGADENELKLEEE